MTAIDSILIGASTLIILGVVVSKISGRFGLPALLLFLIVGMLAGSEGPGRIHFDNYFAAQSFGIVALALILFDGGLRTNYNNVKRAFLPGLSLSTLGVVLTAFSLSVAAKHLLNLDWETALLLGAVVSSTDAAAVFSILRSKGFSLTSQTQSTLEFESGSNDPMAVLLTIGILTYAQSEATTAVDLLILFVQQVSLGLAFGIAGSYVWIFFINRIRLPYDGLYPVLLLAGVIFLYSSTSLLGGSGFLAVYLTGLLMSRKDFIHKNSLVRFNDGVAWMMQIGIFLVLGLLVFPSQLVPVAAAGSILALFLMFVSRPISVFLALLFCRISIREKVMISWVGLRGATPIILSTFPLLAGIKNADLIFNMVFFIVLISVVIQGVSIPLVGRWLKVAEPLLQESKPLLEFSAEGDASDKSLEEFMVRANSGWAGKSIIELGLPEKTLIVMVTRGGSHFVPRGDTELLEGDKLLVIFDRSKSSDLHKLINEGALSLPT